MAEKVQDWIVKLEGVAKVYGDHGIRVTALRDVDLQINGGDFIGIMGPSGSGKTTLLNVIGCLQKPTEGKVFIGRTDVSSLPRRDLARIRARVVGFIFQSRSLLPGLTVVKNVELPSTFVDRSPHDPRERAMSLLEMVGLEKRAYHKPTELSAGEYQRVAVARALMNDPPLILADEPTGNLDSETSGELVELFGKLNDLGKTMIVVTHNPEVASGAEIRMKMRDGVLERVS
jgi:putative ABC transport system ATP-binding protein